MTVISKSEVSAIKLDKDQDIIPITVGLYRLFMASGAAGREAMDLYIHLIFTARLQETQQVRANNVYLARGLEWGQAKVKAAKAWLSEAGLIEYVRTRSDDGQLGEVYIRLRFFPRAEKAVATDSAEPAEPETYQDDLTLDLFEGQDEQEPAGSEFDPLGTTGSETDPLGTTGSVYHPVVDHTHGSRRQMLKIKKEMLKERKEKESPPADDQSTKGGGPHFAIAQSWFARYQRETAIMISPREDDYKAALGLFRALGGDLSRLDEAIDTYFGRYRQFWFAVTRATAKLQDDQKRPEWSFRTFCARYPEILAAAPSAYQDESSVANLRHAAMFRKGA